ncbi:hypothetical protein AB0N31_04800 [Streptomyces sp. NPDC051051]|uniref:hypothetical protein n=1 Tax=Streptomyces sp. NPDC051051 TaxID=3155666 RepID=UPI0034361C2B
MTPTTGTPAAGPEAFLAALRAPAAGAPDEDGAAVPSWLWQVATVLHERLPPAAGDEWARRLRALLAAAPGPGLGAVHLWHADTVLPLLGAARAGDDDVLAALRDLHRAAASDETAGGGEWRAALHPVLLLLHDAAYDRTSAYAEAHTGARDYALANGFPPAEAEEYGHTYARLSSDTNARACAEAHAAVLADAVAQAFAADSPEAYADTFPGAQVRAALRATAVAQGEASASAHLAEGLLRALRGARPRHPTEPGPAGHGPRTQRA